MNHLEESLKKVQELKGEKAWDVQTVVSVGVALGAHLNALRDLTGSQKKELVLAVMRESLTKAEAKEVAEEEKKSGTEESTAAAAAIKERYVRLNAAVADALPISLDLVVAAARGKLDFRKIEPSAWLRLFSCCLTTSVSVLASKDVISEGQAKSTLDKAATLESKAPTVIRRPSEVPKQGTPNIQIS